MGTYRRQNGIEYNEETVFLGLQWSRSLCVVKGSVRYTKYIHFEKITKRIMLSFDYIDLIGFTLPIRI